jgi:hypothetical protein
LSYSKKQPQNKGTIKGGLYSKIRRQYFDRAERIFRKTDRGRAGERSEPRTALKVLWVTSYNILKLGEVRLLLVTLLRKVSLRFAENLLYIAAHDA